MNYGSVCSGIEAATAAWHPLGWEPQWFAEIEAFPGAVLQHHYPDVPNVGDFTKIGVDYDPPGKPIELLVGGTPCQSFSVAGKRLGMDDPRGNLAIEFLRLAKRLQPTWVVFENVPGLLSSDNGRDFYAFLSLLGQCGYGYAYRVLDAQFFGVAQRRRRVFVVGYLGDWRPACAVLLEPESLSRHPAPRREAGEGTTGTVAAGFSAGQSARAGSIGYRDEQSPTLKGAASGTNQVPSVSVARTLSTRNQRNNATDETLVTHTLTSRYDSSEDGCGRGVPMVVHENMGGNLASEDHSRALRAGASHSYQFVVRTAQTSSNGIGVDEDTAYTLDGASGQAIAFDWQSAFGANSTEEQAGALIRNRVQAVGLHPQGQYQGDRFIDPDSDVWPTLPSQGANNGGGAGAILRQQMQVRRLLPTECEALQGFPRGYTDVPYRGKPAADGNRYRALGNSMAVPVMAWIGTRIQQVDALVKALHEEPAA